MTQEKIERINQLARKSKSMGLNEAEREEQKLLRQEYIDSVKNSLISQLENASVIDESGTVTKLKKRKT